MDLAFSLLTSENAVALLDSADQLVAQVSSGTGDAELFAIRKAIGRDITALKLISTVDRDGIYLKLQALGDMVEQLPRIPNHTFVNTSEDNMDDSGVKENPESTSILSRVWYELKAMTGALDQYIKIEDATAPVKPLVDQHFTQVASLNVRLLLEQAQIALLKESPVIYNNSLKKARELIVDYYIPSSQSAEFQKSIAELAIIDVAPKLPDISHSLRLLHAYIQQLHKLETVREGQL
jgi:uroporphyrin-3 C-methyltransferase